MLTNHFSAQATNGLCSVFDNIESAVFWVCNTKHNQQIYLNKGFEAIWNRPVTFMFENPHAWFETILPEDLQKIVLPQHKAENLSCSMKFRIILPNGELKYIKSHSQYLLNTEDEKIALTGVDETLTAEQWHDSMQKQEQENALFKHELLHILEKEFSLSRSLKPQDNLIKPHEKLILNNQIVTISKREAQCLEYLLKGYSAKYTAHLLELSSRTVEKYLNNLRRKTHCRSKVELMKKVYQSIAQQK